MLEQKEIDELKDLCKQNRRNVLKMVNHAKSGHCGGALSAVEILTTLYQKVMNVSPEWKEDRDRFILSKGHASAILYSVLSQKGFFPAEEFKITRSPKQSLTWC